MHIYKVITLFAGSAMAAPTAAILTRATSGTSASPGMPNFSAAQGNAIVADLAAVDKATQSVIAAVNSFTGGSDIQAQGDAIEKSSQDWSATITKMLSDVKALAGKGKFTDADSSRITNTVKDSVAPHLVGLYQAVQNRKPIFVQVGKQTHVYDTLLSLMSELQSICDYLQPLVSASDHPALEDASKKITDASKAVIAAYIG